MNTLLLHSVSNYRMTLLACVGLLLGGLAPVPAATNAAAKVEKTAAKPVVPAVAPIEIPRSEFALPTRSTPGRDPFFPDSSRLSVNASPTRSTNVTAKAASVTLVLQGISGTKAKPYALINGSTFEPGEAHSVTVGKSKIQVVCLTIKDDSVIVEGDGVRQELKLRPGI